MYDGIIFDLDGTLWDSTALSALVLNEEAAKAGITRVVSTEEISACMGMLLPDIGKKLYPGLSADSSAKLLDNFAKAVCGRLAADGGVLYPALHETLKALAARCPLFLVSNCQEGYIQAFFAAHDTAQYFQDFEYPGRTGLPKAENIRLVVRRNALKSPVYVGDTAGDAEAAEQAGLPFVFAGYGFGRAKAFFAAADSLPALIPILAPQNQLF